MKQKHKDTHQSPLNAPDWDAWNELDVESLTPEPASWRVLVEGAPTKLSVAALGIAFYVAFARVAPAGQGLSGLGALVALAMLLGVILRLTNQCRDP